jgi:hypothetical protein
LICCVALGDFDTFPLVSFDPDSLISKKVIMSLSVVRTERPPEI